MSHLQLMLDTVDPDPIFLSCHSHNTGGAAFVLPANEFHVLVEPTLRLGDLLRLNRLAVHSFGHHGGDVLLLGRQGRHRLGYR